ncbi:ureidoglycolate lyase [Pseudooctadecabacter jejudonensis]|uniref:Ureidoglycolate lyase n=1 Tax=Pseudooctadecabacter jejudonensis TaxID=1391910 RepID=A0A1Y5RBW9_9RHOB|nr:ureidoglycolate lyase [Pseudooctadecabacter jejudonensis]SLN13478.1 Ureidoglycolate lyase [Pseudooctadecabacter jejudonensis]
MSRIIHIQPLTKEAFTPFGDVLDTDGAPDKVINQGKCGRYHDRAHLDFNGGRAGVSLFNAQPRSLPLSLQMVERHPDGSQAFIPMSEHGFLIVVAPDAGGTPGTPIAFESTPGQAINFHRGTWHGVLTPLSAPGLFAVVDRIGTGANLEEHWFDDPYVVTPATKPTA